MVPISIGSCNTLALGLQAIAWSNIVPFAWRHNIRSDAVITRSNSWYSKYRRNKKNWAYKRQPIHRLHGGGIVHNDLACKVKMQELYILMVYIRYQDIGMYNDGQVRALNIYIADTGTIKLPW